MLLFGLLALFLAGGVAALIVFWPSDTEEGPPDRTQDPTADLQGWQEVGPGKPPKETGQGPVSDKLRLSQVDRLDPAKLDLRLPPPKSDDWPPPVWAGHTNHVRCVAFTDDGQFVISVSGDTNRAIRRPADNSIRVWDARRGKQVHKLEGFREALDSLSVSPGGRFALFSHGDYRKGDQYIRTTDYGIYLWDIQSKKVIGPKENKAGALFRGLKTSSYSTAVAPDRKTVVAGDASGGLILWETQTGRVIHEGNVPISQGNVVGVVRVKFTPDGSHLIIVCADYTLRVYQTETGRAVSGPLESHLDIIWALDVAQTKKGSTLALSGGGSRQGKNHQFEPGARDYVIRLWDLDKRQVIRRYSGHTREVVCVAFCPNGRHFISGSLDETVRLWDLESGKELRLLGRHEGWVSSVAVSPDGRSCVSGGRDCKVRFWRLPTGQDLVEALARNDPAALRKAVQDMDVIGRDGRVAVPALLRALKKSDEFGRLALKALRQIGPLDKDSVPRLVPLLKDQAVAFRRYAAEALGQIGPAARPATAALTAALQDADAAVARHAARALGQIGPQAREAVPALCRVLRRGTDVDLQGRAADALERIQAKGKEVADTYAQLLRHDAAALRSRALRGLRRLGLGACDVRLIIRARTDPDQEVRRLAEEGLKEKVRSLSKMDVPGLIELLRDRSGEVRLFAAECLAKLGPVAGPAVAALAGALKDGEAAVSRQAARALGEVGPGAREAVPALCAALLTSTDVRLLGLAAGALAKIQVKTKEVVETFTALLRHDATEVRRAALAALIDLGPQAIVLADVLRALADADAEASRLADRAVQKKVASLGKADRADFKLALQAKQVRVCFYAVDALARVVPKAREGGRVAAAITRLKMDPEAQVAVRHLILSLKVANLQDKAAIARREAAAKALVKVGKPAVDKLLLAIRKDFQGSNELTQKELRQKYARLAAVEILARMGPEADTPAAQKALEEIMENDPVRVVREAARKAIVRINAKD
jgi:WD40 repeat protein